MNPPSAPPAAVRDASTVILLSPIAEGAQQFEVFMVQRHAKSQFMASAFVYPGGRLDPEDRSDEMAALTEGLDGDACARRLREAVTPERARGLFVAALREAFEEAGVLLARAPDGLPLPPHDDWRDRLCAQTATLVEMGQATGLRFDLDRLHPFAHWITPDAEPRRYDTRFFIARCPPRQRDRLRHDNLEVVDSLWIQPADALARHRAGRFHLAPPTLRTLEDLAVCPDIDAAINLAMTDPLTPIQPVFTQLNDLMTLLLPGHPDHPDTPRGLAVANPVITLDSGGFWR